MKTVIIIMDYSIIFLFRFLLSMRVLKMEVLQKKRLKHQLEVCH